MLSHTGTLWQYLGSFILYTLLAIGLIYAVFCFTRSRAGSFLGLGTPVIKGRRAKLQIESILGLEPRKNLYVVRAGHERFLLATSIEETKLISRLDSLP